MRRNIKSRLPHLRRRYFNDFLDWCRRQFSVIWAFPAYGWDPSQPISLWELNDKQKVVFRRFIKVVLKKRGRRSKRFASYREKFASYREKDESDFAYSLFRIMRDPIGELKDESIPDGLLKLLTTPVPNYIHPIRTKRDLNARK